MRNCYGVLEAEPKQGANPSSKGQVSGSHDFLSEWTWIGVRGRSASQQIPDEVHPHCQGVWFAIRGQ